MRVTETGRWKIRTGTCEIASGDDKQTAVESDRQEGRVTRLGFYPFERNDNAMCGAIRFVDAFGHNPGSRNIDHNDLTEVASVMTPRHIGANADFADDVTRALSALDNAIRGPHRYHESF